MKLHSHRDGQLAAEPCRSPLGSDSVPRLSEPIWLQEGPLAVSDLRKAGLRGPSVRSETQLPLDGSPMDLSEPQHDPITRERVSVLLF